MSERYPRQPDADAAPAAEPAGATAPSRTAGGRNTSGTWPHATPGPEPNRTILPAPQMGSKLEPGRTDRSAPRSPGGTDESRNQHQRENPGQTVRLVRRSLREIELDINQAGLAHPADVLSQISFAADLARAAVNRELDLQRRGKKMPTPAAPARDRDPGDGDEPWDGDDREPASSDRGDDEPAERDQPSRGRDDRPSSRNYGRDYRNDDRRSDRDDDRPPSTGKQLFGWAKDRGRPTVVL